MTNGEKIKEIFPNVEISPDPYSPSVDICIGGIMMMRVDRNWWNAEYKEPTTKNNLGVDCVARQDVERYIEGFINEYTSKEELEFINLELDGLKHLPSATPQEPRWISVSERLPESNGNYLITYCHRNVIETQEAVYSEDEDEAKWYDTTDIEITLAVTAWMPLPAPFEPQESEVNND